jgi:hypothetical protein
MEFGEEAAFQNASNFFFAISFDEPPPLIYGAFVYDARNDILGVLFKI